MTPADDEWAPSRRALKILRKHIPAGDANVQTLFPLPAYRNAQRAIAELFTRISARRIVLCDPVLIARDDLAGTADGGAFAMVVRSLLWEHQVRTVALDEAVPAFGDGPAIAHAPDPVALGDPVPNLLRLFEEWVDGEPQDTVDDAR